MNDNKAKIEEYFSLIENHIFKPIETTNLSNSCYATIMLLFAVIDGLGKLLHSEEDASATSRFKFFLSFLGKEYTRNENKLWELRNSLMHNGINNISYLSNTQKGESEHLKTLEGDEFIFISSSRLFHDVKTFVTSIRKLILADEKLLNQCGDRLIWNEEDPSSFWNPFSTPPGPVKFVTLK